MTTTQWATGDRIYDDGFRQHGTVIYVGSVFLNVRWDDGTVSIIVPDEGTRKVER